LSIELENFFKKVPSTNVLFPSIQSVEKFLSFGKTAKLWIIHAQRIFF